MPLLAAQPSPAQGSLQINALQGLGGAGVDRQQLGRLTFICPASDGTKATIYGTDTYTDGSPICPAAIHAGVLKAGQAGVVSIVLGSGAESFKGSDRNGVTTRSYGRWGYSYMFARDSAPATVTWRTTWNWNERPVVAVADPITVACPAGGKTDAALIYGTDVYSLDSGICVAAVHSGAISAERGGVVNVTRVPGLRDSPGTERFGVASRSRRATADAFSVMATTSTSRDVALLASSSSAVTRSDASASDAPSTAVNAAGAVARAIVPPAESASTAASTQGEATIIAPAIDAPSFQRPSAQPITEQGTTAPPPPAVAGPRTITVGGFNVVGISSPASSQTIAPLRLQLVGFAVSGVLPTNPPSGVGPLTVTTAGFTIVGFAPLP